jgi:hypothetical protein
MDNMLVSSEAGSRAMAETYRIRAEDTAATTFDGSAYDTAAEAKAAADAKANTSLKTYTSTVKKATRAIEAFNAVKTTDSGTSVIGTFKEATKEAYGMALSYLQGKFK